MKNTTDFPPRSAFKSDINEDGISNDQYLWARNVYFLFGCANLHDYAQLYCLIGNYLSTFNYILLGYALHKGHISYVNPKKMFL